MKRRHPLSAAVLLALLCGGQPYAQGQETAATQSGGIPALLQFAERYQAAPPPRVLQLTRGGHVQTFAYKTWQTVMLRYLDDPQHFNGLRRLGEIPNYPIPKVDSSESPQ